jgi:sodium pump decarboxylase gamma subunit
MNSMFSLMLTADATNLMNSTLTFSERLGLGLKVLLFGMAVVFSVLLLIWGVLSLFRIIFFRDPKKETAEISPEKEAATAPIAEEVIPEAQPDDNELIAAITAAIAAVLESETDKPQTSFRVVSFRRTASK